jgi:hypothetical protein
MRNARFMIHGTLAALGVAGFVACGGGTGTSEDISTTLPGKAGASGATAKGGSAGHAGATGGTSAGGTSAGGTSTGKGGTSAGGSAAGGASGGKGGASAGGSSAGGMSAGGASAGGASAGGKGGAAGGCAAGTMDCDGNPLTGCETQTASDPKNCGTCGKVCATGAHGAAACVGGLCGLTCDQGFADCNKVAVDGCESQPNSDPNNCGKCGNVCPNKGTCVMGACSCAGTSSAAQLIPVDMYVMLDKSGSMGSIDGGSASKWVNVTTALKQFAQSASATGIGMGLQYFPLGNECAVTSYSTPDVGIGTLPGNAAAIVASLAGHNPGGGTPTLPAEQGAVEYTQTWAKAHPTHKVIVVLATDGQPNDCSSTVANVGNAAKAGVTGTPPILTYVIGVGSSTGNLDAIAAAGGTGKAIVVNTGDPASFLAAMQAIQKSQVGCEYLIPAPSGGQMIDYTKVNVVYTPNGNGMPQTILGVASAAACDPAKGGWYYNDPKMPTKIELCPATCTPVQKDSMAKIDVELGCDTLKP